MEFSWVDKHIEVDPPVKCKKITGTRFGAVLGRSPWKSRFSVWCEITKVYEEPFTDTMYTIAGKTIEPKQAEYIRDKYMIDLVTPTGKFGENYFEKTHGDFFNHKVFGGMWDYLDEENKTVYEMKTTQRAEDWIDDIPEYYALQGALYGYLLGYDDVVMVCSLLSPGDYAYPEGFVCSTENTFVRSFKISERYPDIAELVKEATDFYATCLAGVSPDYDEDEDSDTLKGLKTKSIAPDDTLDDMLLEAKVLMSRINEKKKEMGSDEKRLKTIKDYIKKQMMKEMDDVTDVVELDGWKLSKSVSETVDTDRLKADGIYNSYTKEKVTYTLRAKGE